jgi:hypothetical protein
MRETLVAASALPELQREAILRTAVAGHSYEEVAAALGLTNDAVRGLVYRARTTLRTGLAAFAGGLGQWLSEALAGGGSAGGTAVVLKGAAVLASSAAVVGGAVHTAVVSRPSRPTSHVRHASVTRAHADPARERSASPTRQISARQSPEPQDARTEAFESHASTSRTIADRPGPRRARDEGPSTNGVRHMPGRRPSVPTASPRSTATKPGPSAQRASPSETPGQATSTRRRSPGPSPPADQRFG